LVVAGWVWEAGSVSQLAGSLPKRKTMNPETPVMRHLIRDFPGLADGKAGKQPMCRSCKEMVKRTAAGANSCAQLQDFQRIINTPLPVAAIAPAAADDSFG
jgi:hypothetical protein